MKRYLVFSLLLLLLPANGLARPTLPFSKGLLTDTQSRVLAVNLYAPAFYSGIRPGDHLLPAAAPAKQPLLLNSSYLERNGMLYQYHLQAEQLRLPTQQSIFLIPKNALSFTQVLQKIQSDPFLSMRLPIKNIDRTWGLLYTEGLFNSSQFAYDDYVLAAELPPEIRLTAVIFFTAGERADYQLIHINVHCQAKNEQGKWQELPSTGLLPQEIVQHLLHGKGAAPGL